MSSSVVIKWFLLEEHSSEAKGLLAIEYRLIAPDLMPIEMTSIAWKRVRGGDLTTAEAVGILSDLRILPIAIENTIDLLPKTLEIAAATNRSVYDCLYLALAIERGCQFVTADTRFRNALSETPHAERILHVMDLPA